MDTKYDNSTSPVQPNGKEAVRVLILQDNSLRTGENLTINLYRFTYMGYVHENLAEEGQIVKGVIIWPWGIKSLGIGLVISSGKQSVTSFSLQV
ncbi:hypothetical protein ACPUYX_09880 [Desulfosporosinus sp. SYSU MS00001]|uniref:hypothetical protein n=1 Tax=Desulfosporosinus sp. SYSU MS00001 TaxID=3416284 RepID=UPI003CE8D1AB